MSRADREKSLYIIRLNQIKDELRQHYAQEFSNHSAKSSKTGKFSFNMHAESALEQIQEKVTEEYQSDEDDQELEEDPQEREDSKVAKAE